MANGSNIDERIRDAYNGRQRRAPQDVWEQIDRSLDTDIHLDNVLKEAANDIHRNAPESVWHGVKRQLTLDRSWGVIHQALDRLSFYRKLWRMALPVLLVLLAGTGIYLGWRSEYDKLPGLAAATAVQKLPALSHIISGKHTHSGRSNGAAQYKNNEIVSAVNTMDRKHPGNTTVVSKGTARSITVADKLIHFAEKENTSTGKDNLQMPPAMSVLPPHMLSTVPPDEPDLNSDPFVIPESAKKKYHQYLLGLFYSFNNTWLVNNEVRQSFNPNSLVSADLSFAAGYGLNGAFYLAPKSGISFNAYLRSTSKLSYFMYDEGKYINKEIELNYYKLSLSYMRDFNLSVHSKCPTVFIQSGIYGALMEKMQVKTSDGTMTMPAYRTSDFGLSFQAGYRYRAGHFALGTGLNVEKGLYNIFAGTSGSPAGFNVTTPFNIGASISIQYIH